MDVVAFHKTDQIKKSVKALNSTMALIPPGMTSLLQPYDTAANYLLKKRLQEITDRYDIE